MVLTASVDLTSARLKPTYSESLAFASDSEVTKERIPKLQRSKSGTYSYGRQWPWRYCYEDVGRAANAACEAEFKEREHVAAEL